MADVPQQPRQVNSPPHRSEEQTAAQGQLYSLPNGAAVGRINEVLSSWGALEEVPDRDKRVSSNHRVAVERDKSDNSKRLITWEGKGGTTSLSIDNIALLHGTNKDAKALFTLILLHLQEAVYENGTAKDYLTFSLQELVDMGGYSSLETARRAVINGGETLTSLKLAGSFKRTSRGKEHRIDKLTVPFYGVEIASYVVKVYLAQSIDWLFFTEYFTVIPGFYFKLLSESVKAADLALFIFRQARQNEKSITDSGCFYIRYNTLQQRLRLPQKENTKNPWRDIIEPIEAAITKIEDTINELYGTDKDTMKMTPVYKGVAGFTDIPESINTAELLEKGYLKVAFFGEFRDKLETAEKRKREQIAAKAQRDRRIKEKAAVKNLADKMKNGDE